MSVCSTNSLLSFKVLDVNTLQSHTYQNNNLYKSIPFLTLSASILKNVEHVFVEVNENDKAIGLLTFQILPFKGKELSSYLPKEDKCFFNKTVDALVDLALDRINWKLLVLGNVFFTGDNGQIWFKNVEGKEKWKLVREAAKYITKRIKIDAFLISDVYLNDCKEDNYLIDKSYRKFEVEPDLIFAVNNEWKNFDDYLQSLSSKYRVRTNKVFSKSSKLTTKSLSAEELKNQNKKLFTLYQNVINQADFKLAEIPENYLVDFKQAMGNAFQVRTYSYNDTLLGFISFFEAKDVLHINFVGLDYTQNKELCVYQRILYDCIEQGILLGKKEIHFGRTATEIKTAVGAQPQRVFAYLKHVNTIPNLAIKPLTTYLKPEPFEARNPFKIA